jgi:sensor histidine kinase YesM
MTLHDFIFSKKIRVRLTRHITFWVVQDMFWVIWAASIFNYNVTIWLLKWNGFFVLEMLFTYWVVYYIFPKNLINRNKFFLWLFSSVLITYLLFIIFHFWFEGRFNIPTDDQLLSAWFYTMNFIIGGPPVVCALFLTLKMFKNYYIKMEEKLFLAKENAEAELQLLKAQIHPHFLFNTLNNIYSFTLNKSPQAGSLVKKLSDTLRYMVNDCEEALVPLEKEIKMIQDYIGLEKVRYGKRLSIEMVIIGDCQNKLITPLLLIPFVENCFKHGTSKMLEQPWIKLEINIIGDELVMNLGNSKPIQIQSSKDRVGIGLKNVHTRLKLIYPNNHVIKISSDENSYTVFLTIPLLQSILKPEEDIESNKVYPPETLSYVYQ